MSAAYFISDMHLGAPYVADPREHERRVCRWLDSLRAPGAEAAELYILGDALDYWYEYRNVVPRGYVRFFGSLAALADAGVQITWLTGNHDIWLFDYLSTEIGLTVVDAPMYRVEILGSRFVLAHGDRIGPQKASFRFICHMFRNRTCQRLYSALHPRLTIPFAHGWSRRSRQSGAALTPGEYAARLAPVLRESAREVLQAYPDAQHIVIGHHHHPFQAPVEGAACDLTVLGDWISGGSYARFDGNSLSLVSI